MALIYIDILCLLYASVRSVYAIVRPSHLLQREKQDDIVHYLSVKTLYLNHLACTLEADA